MTTRVVHCRREPYDVYIGRPSIWGNPWSSKPSVIARYHVATRLEAIEAFEKWLRSNPQIMSKAKHELRGKVLGCFCVPRPCHGDVLARVADEDTYRVFSNDRRVTNEVPMYSCLKEVSAASAKDAIEQVNQRFNEPNFAPLVAIKWPPTKKGVEWLNKHVGSK